MIEQRFYKLGHALHHNERQRTLCEERLHIVQGLMWAKDNPMLVLEVMQTSNDLQQAKAVLIEKYGLSQCQAQAVIDMRMRNYLDNEGQKLEEEYQNLLKDYVVMVSV